MLSHKIKIYPNQKAERYLRSACGTARFAYNWALQTWIQKYQSGEKGMSGFSLVKEFNSIKDESYPWVREVSKWVPQKAIQDLGDAFKRFFKKESKYPQFKKKGRSKDSFYLGEKGFKVSGKYLKVGLLERPIKMSNSLRFKGEIKSVTISRSVDEWFASFSIKIPEETFVYAHACESQDAVGIDLGIKTLAVCSNGTEFENPKPLRLAERKIKKLNKSVSRKQKGSSNRAKACLRLVRAHRKVARIRSNSLHQITSWLVKTFRFIGIEDLNVRGMIKNHKLAKSISDAAFYEFKRQLEYKSKLSGSNIVLADRFFPSSKTCSCCGYIYKELALSERVWTCPVCGAKHERDVNASKNLEFVALRYKETLNACREGVSPNTVAAVRRLGVGLSSVKQESKQNLKPLNNELNAI
jgi:putative transposase